MYQEPLPTKVVFELIENEDPELTCFVCKSKATCELGIPLRFQGMHVVYGIHLGCVKRIGEIQE